MNSKQLTAGESFELEGNDTGQFLDKAEKSAAEFQQGIHRVSENNAVS